MLRLEGVTLNVTAPFPPQHPTRVTTSLERDLENCCISITYTTESRHNGAEKLGFMWCSFPSRFLAKFEMPLQQGRHWESKCSWQSSAAPCSLPRLIQDRDHFSISKCFTCSLRHQGPKEALKSNIQLFPGCREQNLTTAELQLLFTLFPRTR